jgi:hypothetical protein
MKHYFQDEHLFQHLHGDLLHAMYEINNVDFFDCLHHHLYLVDYQENLMVESFQYIYLTMLLNVLLFYDHLHRVMELLLEWRMFECLFLERMMLDDN